MTPSRITGIVLRYMKSAFRLIILVFLITGCTKETSIDIEDNTSTEEPTGGSTYNPTGNLAIYVDSLGIMPFNASDSCCTHLCFAVYDMDGARVKQTNQKFGDSHYGAVGMQLEKGTYRLVVLAHSGTKNPTMTNAAKIQFSNATRYTDTYLYSDTLTVTAAQARIHTVPRRIVARCSFVICDAIPDSVAQMKFSYKGGSAHVDATTGFGVTHSTQVASCDVTAGERNTHYDLYTIPFGPDEDTLRLTVTVLDAEGSKLQERQFDVPIRLDRLTWFAGCFFSESNSDEWTITPNQDFDSAWPDEMYLTY